MVLLAGASGPILHRLLSVAGLGGRAKLLHRGDGGGGIGVANADRLLGQAVAVSAPDPRPIGSAAELSGPTRRTFCAGVRRARLWTLLWRVTGTAAELSPAWVRRWVRRLVLGRS